MACRSVYITGPCDAGMAVEKLIEDFDWLKTAGHASAEHVDGERGLFLKFSGISGASRSAGHQGGLVVIYSVRWPVYFRTFKK